MAPVTGIAPVDWFLGYLDTIGYPIVYGFTLFENIFVVGSFTPGETVVIAAAFIASPTFEALSLPLVWVSSVLGTVTGCNISYFLGRKGGRDALLRYGSRFHISERRIADAEAYFERHGSKTVLLARFTAGFKNFVPMIAGVSRMNIVWFQVYTLLGAMLYTSLMVGIGYFVGGNFDKALMIASRITNVGMVIAIVVIVGAVVLIRRARRRAKEGESTA